LAQWRKAEVAHAVRNGELYEGSGVETPAMATTASSVICRLESKRLRGFKPAGTARQPDGVQRLLPIEKPAEHIEVTSRASVHRLAKP